MDSPHPARTGTQSVERAVQMLAEITTRHRFGWRPSDLARRCGLDRGTTHRILACLVRSRLVRQRQGDRHYVPGPMLFEMGLALPAYSAFQACLQPGLARLARRLSVYALLCVRSGEDTVCIATGGTPAYRGTAFEVGTRRPLTATAAGMAILIAMPRDEARSIVAGQLPRSQLRDEPSQDALLRMWRKSLSLGFALNQGYTAPGVHAVGVPLRDLEDTAFGSLTVAGTAARLPAGKVAETAAILEEEAETILRLARETLPEGTYNAGTRVKRPRKG